MQLYNKEGGKLLTKERIIIAILVLIIIFGGFFMYQSMIKTNIAKNLTQNKQEILTEVQVVPALFEEINSSIELPARVKSVELSEVRPQVSGILQEIHFKEGTFVKKGDQLYTIDQTTYLAMYNKAKSVLNTAKMNKERATELFPIGAISKKEYDDAINNYELAKGDFETAKANLGYTKVFAPISGFITKSNYTKGALISVGQGLEMSTITKLSPIYAEITIPSKALYKLEGQSNLKVEVSGDGFAEEGILEFSQVVVNQTTDSVILRAIFENSSKKLMPGMYVTAKIFLPAKSVALVPQRATIRKPDGSLNVLLVNTSGVIESKVIMADEASGDKWLVKSGISNGDLILFEGFQKIKEGMKVKPIQKMDENMEVKKS